MMGDVQLAGPLQQPLDRGEKETGADDRRINEADEVARDEDEELRGVAKTVIAQREPGDHVVRDVIEKDHPQPDPAKQIETEVALNAADDWSCAAGVHGASPSYSGFD